MAGGGKPLQTEPLSKRVERGPPCLESVEAVLWIVFSRGKEYPFSAKGFQWFQMRRNQVEPKHRNPSSLPLCGPRPSVGSTNIVIRIECFLRLPPCWWFQGKPKGKSKYIVSFEGGSPKQTTRVLKMDFGALL